MLKNVKMSKYNLITKDNEENLIVYNFLTGMSSLTKIMQSDVEEFKKIFLTDKEITMASCEMYTEEVDVLRNLGILVDTDVDENILYDAKIFDEVYNNKLVLTILSTGKCNFRCPYCFETPQHFNREDMTKEAQNAVLNFVQREIPNHKALRVAWFGGEPLVAPEIIKYLSVKIIKICEVRHIPYFAEMTTNGYLLDADMFDMLYKLKVYQYMITIDGFKEQHDKQRFTLDGKGSYDVIMNNLLNIRDSKQYKFAHIRIRINMSNSFLEILDDFVGFIASLFADDPRFEFMFVPVVKFSGSKYSDKNLCKDRKEFYKRLFMNDVYKNILCPENYRLNSIVRQRSCYATIKNSYVITPDLKVHKCNAHYDFDANKVGFINLKGDMVLDEAIHKRWYLTKRFVQKLPESCNDCFYMPCCTRFDPGCPTSYLRATPEEIPCPMKDKKQENDIVETVQYAASKYPCTVLAF